MQLLIFAHRGEAQVFLKNLDLSLERTSFGEVYKNDKLIVLITGEGLQNASEMTSACLGFFAGITEVLNMGICAGLSADLKKFDLLPVRTVYAYDSTFKFKSFTSSQVLATHDCVSASQRVTQKTQKEAYFQIAPLIDRELWAIASCSQRFKKKWSSVKIVSDILDEQTDCQDIFEDALEFSSKLFQYFQQMNKDSNTSSQSQSEIEHLESLGFYFTFSQKSKISKLIKSIMTSQSLRFQDLLQNFLEKNNDLQDMTGKQQSKHLEQFLLQIANPIEWKTKNKLNKLLENKNLKINFDSSLEKEEINFQGIIRNISDLEKLSQEIKKIPFKDFVSILNGKI